jgi:hypothetical protein
MRLLQATVGNAASGLYCIDPNPVPLFSAHILVQS